MGGQHGYFGLWLDSNFGSGHSRARPKCTTYGSPQLSGQEDFSLDSMEVWAVGKPPEPEVVRVFALLYFLFSFIIHLLESRPSCMTGNVVIINRLFNYSLKVNKDPRCFPNNILLDIISPHLHKRNLSTSTVLNCTTLQAHRSVVQMLQ